MSIPRSKSVGPSVNGFGLITQYQVEARYIARTLSLRVDTLRAGRSKFVTLEYSMSTDAMDCTAGFGSTYFNFPLPTHSTTRTRLPLIDHGGIVVRDWVEGMQ